MEFQTDRRVYGLIFADVGEELEFKGLRVQPGGAVFIKGELENETGTVVTPFKLLAKPSLPRALWYVLTGKFKAYCHIESCPYSGSTVNLLKKCDTCNYRFSVARKMLRLLRNLEVSFQPNRSRALKTHE